MTDKTKELWDDLEQAFLKNDTETPIHTLLVFRVYEKKIREGYARELGFDPETLDSMLDDLLDATEDLGSKEAEIVKQVADTTADLAEGNSPPGE